MNHESSSPLQVIIVDDESSIRHSLGEFLEDVGFSVTTAASAEEALRLISEHRFDIAVVDLRLPGMTGDIMIQQAHEIAPRLQYLIHTGSVNYSLSVELRNLGMKPEQVIQKPVADLSLISEAIQRLGAER